MMVKKLILIFGLVFIFGCEFNNKKQHSNIFPPNIKLNLEISQERGITEYYVYQVSRTLSKSELKGYPIVKREFKEKIGWHIPTNKEINDFKEFVSKEQSHEIAAQVSERVSKGNYLLAIIYDRGVNYLGSKNYTVSDWQDLYFYDVLNNKLTIIKYGKF